MYEVLLLTQDLKAVPEYLIGNNQEVTYLVLDTIDTLPSNTGYNFSFREIKIGPEHSVLKSVKELPEFNEAEVIKYHSFSNLFNVNNIHEVILKYNEIPHDIEFFLMAEVAKRNVSVSFRGYFASGESELVLLNDEGIFIFEFNSKLISYPYQGFEARTVSEFELYTLMEYSDLEILVNQTFLMITLDDSESPKLLLKDSLSGAIQSLDYLKGSGKPVEIMLIKKILNSNELLSLYEEFRNG